MYLPTIYKGACSCTSPCRTTVAPAWLRVTRTWSAGSLTAALSLGSEYVGTFLKTTYTKIDNPYGGGLVYDIKYYGTGSALSNEFRNPDNTEITWDVYNWTCGPLNKTSFTTGTYKPSKYLRDLSVSNKYVLDVNLAQYINDHPTAKTVTINLEQADWWVNITSTKLKYVNCSCEQFTATANQFYNIAAIEYGNFCDCWYDDWDNLQGCDSYCWINSSFSLRRGALYAQNTFGTTEVLTSTLFGSVTPVNVGITVATYASDPAVAGAATIYSSQTGSSAVNVPTTFSGRSLVVDLTDGSWNTA